MWAYPTNTAQMPVSMEQSRALEGTSMRFKQKSEDNTKAY